MFNFISNLPLGTKILYGVCAVLLLGGVGYLTIGFRNYFRPLSIFKKTEEKFVHARLTKKRKIIKKQEDKTKVQFVSVKDYTIFEEDFVLDDGSVLTVTVGEWNYGRYHVGDTGILGYKEIGTYGNVFCDFNVEVKKEDEIETEDVETIEE